MKTGTTPRFRFGSINGYFRLELNLISPVKSGLHGGKDRLRLPWVRILPGCLNVVPRHTVYGSTNQTLYVFWNYQCHQNVLVVFEGSFPFQSTCPFSGFSQRHCWVYKPSNACSSRILSCFLRRNEDKIIGMESFELECFIFMVLNMSGCIYGRALPTPVQFLLPSPLSPFVIAVFKGRSSWSWPHLPIDSIIHIGRRAFSCLSSDFLMWNLALFSTDSSATALSTVSTAWSLCLILCLSDQPKIEDDGHRLVDSSSFY